ncbi:MAG: hypothetical protein ABJ239_08350 [Erythrobacter sp.]
MIDFLVDPYLVIAGTCLVGLCIVATALQRAWQGWLSLKQRELDSVRHEANGNLGVTGGMGAARIEISDLKERIKKLEAIANGVDL